MYTAQHPPFASMGVQIKGTGVDRSPHMTSRGCHSTSGTDVTPSAGDSSRTSSGGVVAKLSRSRRPARRAKQQHQRHHHQHRHQQHQKQRNLDPVPDIFFADLATPQEVDPSLQHTASLPRLGQPVRPQEDMQRTPSYGNGQSTPTKGAVYPASLRNLIHSHGSAHSASTEKFSQVSAASSEAYDGEGRDDGRQLNDEEQQAIRRGLEDLLARPPPSFDYSSSVPDNGGRQNRDYPLLRGGDSVASSSLPELFLSRTTADGRGEERRCSSESMVGSTLKSTGRGQGRRTKKPTRSQSGGHLRPAPCSTVANTGRGAASSGAGPTRGPTKVAASFEGSDAVLLEQAFAFAERVAREEETVVQDSCNSGTREGRRLRRDRGGESGADLKQQLHGGDRKGGRLRRTRSSGSSIALETGGGQNGGSSSGAGGGSRIEVEDWVRGLPEPSLHASLYQRQLNHQQSSRSINQAPSTSNNTISGGEAGGGHHARGVSNRRGNKVTVGFRKKQNATDETGGEWRFDRRREKEGNKRATTTVELVQQFETGAGVAALRAELEASQASMRRSTEAIEQVASQWHQQRSMLPSAAGTGER